MAGTYMYLVPAGMVAIEPALASAGNRLRRMIFRLGVSLAATLPLTLPVLPASDIGFRATVNAVLTETVGWPPLVAEVDRAWFSLTPAQRAVAVIFTSNYGEEGAINELGRPLGLPEAVGGLNNDWWWGPGRPNAQVVLAVAPGGHIYLCTEPKLPWGQMWPDLRHYS